MHRTFLYNQNISCSSGLEGDSVNNAWYLERVRAYEAPLVNRNFDILGEHSLNQLNNQLVHNQLPTSKSFFISTFMHCVTFHSRSPATAPELLAQMPSELLVQCNNAITSIRRAAFISSLNVKCKFTLQCIIEISL